MGCCWLALFALFCWLIDAVEAELEDELDEEEEAEEAADEGAPEAAAAAASADIEARLSLSGEFRQVWIKALPASEMIIGCNLGVAKV